MNERRSPHQERIDALIERMREHAGEALSQLDPEQAHHALEIAEAILIGRPAGAMRALAEALAAKEQSQEMRSLIYRDGLLIESLIEALRQADAPIERDLISKYEELMQGDRLLRVAELSEESIEKARQTVRLLKRRCKSDEPN